MPVPCQRKTPAPSGSNANSIIPFTMAGPVPGPSQSQPTGQGSSSSSGHDQSQSTGGGGAQGQQDYGDVFSQIKKKHKSSGPGLTNNSAQQQSTPQNAPSTNTQQSSGLFGSNTNAANTSTTGGSGLFGSNNNTANTSNTGGTGLFGNNANTANTSNTGSSSLFGNNTNTANTSNTGGAGLFGNNNNAGNTSNTGDASFRPQQGNSLFGGVGGLGGNQATNSAPNMFAPSANSQSMFSLGGSRPANQMPQPSAPSLLGATQHAQMNNSAPFGRLSMGQSNAGTTNTVGAVKIDYDSMRPTTRFEDCSDQVRQQLEDIDRVIQEQESLCKALESSLPGHDNMIMSLGPDIDFIKNKVEDVEQALVHDAVSVDAQRQNAAKDRKDLERCERIIHNLHLPQMYHYSSMSGIGGMYGSQQRPQQAPPSNDPDDLHNYDTDLIGNYFVPLANELQQTMNAYAGNLSEIENHLRVIEGSASAQAQQLAQRKAGINGDNAQARTENTVQELADTLRGFEMSILGTAGLVGECREGVNELVLARFGPSLGNRPY
ncbi:Hypothetical predicted protein [Lecanosticta acicola]|uniref:Nucleoporin NUP49/NSP49 n=1 Tax=Lecanosticta acicola TaxID=111012 RepID=A0AAI9E914_9PEZI|nr:Hypothetical predicted protein [Lecanosticta acicola]